ncbi:B3 domain-containing protein Os01g0723500-like [Prosopis cineraria]|uniref:B3 domain-containing protein Os01g0723500-like n=1 Tax=Prosopis cineraria TaxID=364024 RepID=UPI0024101485|nr:B3 domain-containing protein Os01g0723500-like [Prosopis cineraria]
MASQSPRKHAKKPSFFKVLIRDFSTRLKIPPAFMKEFGKDMSKKTSTLIETYNGRSWEVEVEKLGNKFYFNSGWHKFVEDNNLETGDFLVFKYFADYSKFKVKIFGKTCCEKQSNVVVEERPCEPLNGKVDRQRNAQEGTKEGGMKKKKMMMMILQEARRLNLIDPKHLKEI